MSTLPDRPDPKGPADTGEVDSGDSAPEDTVDPPDDSDSEPPDDSDPDSDSEPVEPDEDGDGFSTAEGDCDDQDAALNPEDRDGDGFSTCEDDCDDTSRSSTPEDADNDGWSSCEGDCADSDRATFPGSAEAESGSACMTDVDNDGWGDATPSGAATGGDDCDDGDATRNPAETDVPWDGRDQDCDGADAGSSQTTSGGGGSIPDRQDSSFTATLGSCSTLYDVEVSVDISHTYVGDLVVSLRDPAGTTVVLHNRTGGSGNQITGTYAVTAGTLTPAQSLSNFLGDSGSGTWTLTIADEASGDSGTLNSWGITAGCP